MKKVLAVCSVLVASTSLAMAQNSTDPNMMDNWDMQHFYIGGDFGYSDLDYNSELNSVAEDSLPMLNVYMGFNIDEIYAIEWGGFMTSEESKGSGASKTKSEEYGIFVDAVGKYAFNQDIAALGTLGVQYSKLNVDNSTTDISKNELAPRLGAGLEYKLSDDMKIRGMARYVFSDYDNAVDNGMQYTIGMNYTF